MVGLRGCREAGLPVGRRSQQLVGTLVGGGAFLGVLPVLEVHLGSRQDRRWKSPMGMFPHPCYPGFPLENFHTAAGMPQNLQVAFMTAKPPCSPISCWPLSHSHATLRKHRNDVSCKRALCTPNLAFTSYLLRSRRSLSQAGKFHLGIFSYCQAALEKTGR